MSDKQFTKYQVTVMPRDVILDTQGRAVEDSLRLSGVKINSCRVGKFIELEIPGDAKTAGLVAKKIAEETLHNPLLETYMLKEI